MMWIVNTIYWLHAFAAPVILTGVIGFLAAGSVRAMIILLVIGAVAGFLLAEYIRRKIGLSVFFSRIYGPNEMDRKKEE